MGWTDHGSMGIGTSLFSALITHMTDIPFIKTQKYAVICTDLIIENDKGDILIEKCGVDPMKDKWILPSGYVKLKDNNIEAAALRSAREEVSLDIELTHLVNVLGDPEAKPPADPRFYGVQVVYRATPKPGAQVDVPTALVKDAMWIKPCKTLWKKMGYNHRQIIKKYLKQKKNNQLIPIERSVYSEQFDTYIDYDSNDYMHTVAMGIVLNEKNEILMGYRGQDPFKGHWDLPGGHMYVHESIEECLIREVHEELGVDCEVGDLFHVYSDKGMSPRFARAMVLYFIEVKSQKFVKNVELTDFKYFPLDQLPDNVAYHCEGALQDIKKFILNKKQS